MSLTFKFDKLGENPEKKDEGQSSEAQTGLESYSGAGSVRNVCFVEESGDMTFLNYAYLIAGEFQVEEQIITLIFTTHNVLIKGRNLENLYEAFMNHVPRKIPFMSVRYAALMGKDEIFVSNIKVQGNGDND